MSAARYQTYRSELSDVGGEGKEYELPQMVTVVLATDYDELLVRFELTCSTAEDRCYAQAATIATLEARIQALEEALKVCHQALLEVAHAQDVGCSWYTHGAAGLYRQVHLWVRNGLTAIGKVRNQEFNP